MALTKIVFEAELTLMKRLLRIGEFKFGENSAAYRYYREEVMKASHGAAKEIFDKLEEEGRIEDCPCGADGTGWTRCNECGGSGYREKEPGEGVSGAE